jgi:hypothetical protein
LGLTYRIAIKSKSFEHSLGTIRRSTASRARESSGPLGSKLVFQLRSATSDGRFFTLREGFSQLRCSCIVSVCTTVWSVT